VLLDAYQVSVGNGLTKTSQASKNRLSLADFNIDINSDEGKQLVQAKSQHEELVVAVRVVELVSFGWVGCGVWLL
jgi:hypothetical protein